MIVSANDQTITFVKTGGVLAADTYTVTFRSAANGFVDTSGNLLDGNADGTPGDNYVTTFTVAPSYGPGPGPPRLRPRPRPARRHPRRHRDRPSA